MILELFKTGQQLLLDESNEAESKKKGVLRGGNSGMQLDSGEIAGVCAAKTYLRFSGVQTGSLEQDADVGGRALMFEAGRINEDAWYTVLSKAWPHKVLREEEIPTSWTTENGTLVTGRPDMALLDENDKPIVGIELKLVSSIWTARTVLITKTPKFSHLTQAAHYMWQMGCPFELWYTNRTDFESSVDFQQYAYPKYGKPGSELFNYRFYKLSRADVEDDEGLTTTQTKRSAIDEYTYLLLREAGEDVEAKVAKYKPFIQGFHLFFDNKGRLWYRDACAGDKAQAKMTVITRDGIERFYNTVAELKEVPKEPITIKPDGKKENYKLSAYCELGKQCCKYKAGTDIEKWVCDVKKVVDNDPKRMLKS